jgi:hypothetical protein
VTSAPNSTRTAQLITGAIALAIASAHVDAQSATPGYPVIPRSLSDSAEITLAMSAAPAEISSNATIWGFRDAKAVVLRKGTNGAACIVSRDLHNGGVYPICYDREAAKMRLEREILENTLRRQGKSEDEVRAAVREAHAKGTLTPSSRMAVAYMMSPRQVLFSSPLAEGRRVGAWHPHLMITGPGLSAAGMGLATKSAVEQFSVDSDEHGPTLIVKLGSWSDGSVVK